MVESNKRQTRRGSFQYLLVFRRSMTTRSSLTIVARLKVGRAVIFSARLGSNTSETLQRFRTLSM